MVLNAVIYNSNFNLIFLFLIDFHLKPLRQITHNHAHRPVTAIKVWVSFVNLQTLNVTVQLTQLPICAIVQLIITTTTLQPDVVSH